ncbi:MAG: DNA repair protein RecO [Patescibacteria group bacterium]
MRTQAVILKKIPVKEYDALVVCYTDIAGKQTYQAKSVLKPTSVQSGHLDLFNLVDFALIEGNGHAIITGAHSLRAYSRLKNNLAALAAAYFLLECFDKLIFAGEPDQKLWRFLTARLEFYDQVAENAAADWSLIIKSTKTELLKTLGYDATASIEELTGGYFRSLQFAKKVVG